MTVLIATDQFLKICPRVPAGTAQQWVSRLNTICPSYGINSKDIFHEFFANLCEECGEFTVFEENLNYSAKGLRRVWPARFPTLDSTIGYTFNPEKLANKVYMRQELGNIYPGDGWTFRGSGPIMITGRANVYAFGKYMNEKFGILKKPEEWAQLLRTSIEYGVHSACWIFSVVKQLNDEALNDDMKKIVERINGGLTNYDKRMRYLQLAENIIV